MENVHGIEGFVREFLEWYAPFLHELEGHQENVPIRKQGLQRVRGRYPIFDCTQGTYIVYEEEREVLRGNLEALVGKEREMEEKIHELETKHTLKSRRYGALTSPHYNLFIKALEFPLGNDSEQSMAVELLYADERKYRLRKDIALRFNPLLSLPSRRFPQRNRNFYRQWEHPQGPEKGRIVFEVVEKQDGRFMYQKRRVFTFQIEVSPQEANTVYSLNSPIVLKERHLGTGALTAFLEMIQTNLQ